MKAIKQTINSLILTGTLLLALLIPTAAIVQQPPVVKNIVLVHGAFVDGSGWKNVYDGLSKKGYHVSIVQETLTSYTADGYDYIDPTKFAADFAGGVHKELAGFMAYSQMPTADSAFHAIIKNPAWRTKPSWYMVAKADKIINPDLERLYAKRANSHKVEIDGASHSVFITHPKEVTNLIIDAASQALDHN